jgi:hypothetical protein
VFKRAPIEPFTKTLADDITKRYPVAIDQQPDKRPSVNRLTRIVEDACKKAAEFQAEYKLGWLGKAKLANALKWQLSARGYRKEFVDLATEAVVVQLSRRAGRALNAE